MAALLALKGRLLHGKQVDLKFAVALEEPDPAGEAAPRLRAKLRVGAASSALPSGDAWEAGVQSGQAVGGASPLPEAALLSLWPAEWRCWPGVCAHTQAEAAQGAVAQIAACHAAAVAAPAPADCPPPPAMAASPAAAADPPALPLQLPLPAEVSQAAATAGAAAAAAAPTAPAEGPAPTQLQEAPRPMQHLLMVQHGPGGADGAAGGAPLIQGF